MHVLQEQLLDCLKRELSGVSVYLTNGICLHGRLAGFDKVGLLLVGDRVPLYIFKHTVATVIGNFPLAEPALEGEGSAAASLKTLHIRRG